MAPCGRSHCPLSPQLETNFQRPLATRHSLRVQSGVRWPPTSRKSSYEDTVGCTENQSHDRRGEGTGSERSNPENIFHRRFHKPNVPSAKVRWVVASSHQPQGLEQARDHTPFQDGINKDGEGPHDERRLVTEVGPKGCIPCCSNSPGTPGIPQVPMARPTLAVSSSPFRPKQCPVRLYKALETSGVDASKVGNQASALSGRHANNGKAQGGGQESLSHNHGPPAVPWVHNQPEEERPLTNTGTGVSGICPEVSQDDHCFTGSEVTNLEEDGQADDGTRRDNDPGPSSLGRDDGGSTPWNSPGTTPLPTVGSGQGKSNQAWPIVRLQDPSHHRHEIRLSLVGKQSQLPQWTLFTDYTVGLGDRVRCIPERMGSQLRREQHRGSLDIPGEITPHQLPGITGGLLGPEIVCLSPESNIHSASLGQCHSHCLHQQDGWYTLPIIIRPCGEDLELVYREGNNDSCKTPPREVQHQGRLGVASHSRLNRLEATTGNFPPVASQSRPFHDRSVCVKDKHPTPPVLQLETGSGGCGSGCLVHSMEGPLSLHVSAIRPHTSVPEQTRERRSISNSYCTSMVKPGLVPTRTQESCGLPNPSSPTTGYCNQPGGTNSSTGTRRPFPTSRMACIGQSLSSEGLSEGVISIIRQSWRPSTESSYSSAWRQWDSWCSTRGIDPLSAPLSSILEFLLEQFNMGKQYRTINSLRSAISMTHSEVDGSRVGQHPLVSRFLKGVFNSRPPAPKYSSTWDVDIVLDYIRGLPDNEQLPFSCYHISLLW